MTSERRIVVLDRAHDRVGFDCGVESLNIFLRERALKHVTTGYSRTYVLVAGDSPEILAYYSLAAGEIACVLLPEEQRAKLPKHPVPVVRLCRPATSMQHRAQGLGGVMLIDALRRSAHLASHLGVHAVEVDALDDSARTFYQKFGFQSLLDDTRHLYLPIRAALNIVKLLGT